MEIKQSYHGNGGKEGYKFELYESFKKIGEIEDLPIQVEVGSTVEINGEIYSIYFTYDCDESPEELEVMWYILKPFEPIFKLKLKNN